MYWFVGVAVLALLGAALVGLVKPLRFFGRKRWVAALIGVVALFGGSASLRALDPDRGSSSAAAKGEWDAVWEAPERYIAIDVTYGRQHGVLTVRGTLRNSAAYPISDVRLKCEAFAPSGSKLGRKSITVFKVVPPKEATGFGPLDVMSLDQQTTGAVCTVADASVPGADCVRHPTDARCAEAPR